MDVLNEKNIRKLLPCLLILFVLTNLMVQAFVTVSPVLAEEFHVSASKVSMIVTLSTVALGVCSVVYGTLSDYIPVKKLLLFGTAVFVSGSAFGLLFQNYFYMVVAARVLQTVGQAAISSLYLVITSRYTKGKEKLKYFAWFTACFQIAQACGVLAGGIFAAYVNWKALFVISMAAAAFIPVIWKYAPVENEGKIKHVDVVGIGLFSICIVAIMLMLSDFRPVYAGIEILMLAVFFIYISKREDAFVTPGFFRENRNYTKAVILVFALYLSQFVFAFICTFVVSTLYPRSLDLVSYILLPGYIVAAVVGMNGDKITARLGRYQTISLGAFLIFLGLLSAAFFMDKGKIVLSISGIIFFAGYNTIYSPMLDTVTGALPSAEVGRGIGINDLTINISSSIGVAICSRFMMVNYLKQHVIAPVSESVYVYSNIFIILSLAAIISLISFRKSMKVFYK